jgi:hypothetical protein
MRPMPKNENKLSQASKTLDDELVPLTVAATVTYFLVTEPLRQVSSQEELAQIVHLVAIALSTVAPISIRAADGSAARLGNQELDALLFAPLRRGETPDLEQFSMRRGDLRKAMTTLKEARVAFGRR